VKNYESPIIQESRFKLRAKELEYIKDKGLEKIKSHAEDFIRDRVADLQIQYNDLLFTDTKSKITFFQYNNHVCYENGLSNKPE